MTNKFDKPIITKPFFAYQLLDPVTDLPFYVGYGQTNRSDGGFRPNDHLREARRQKFSNKHKVFTIRKLLSANTAPKLVICGEFETKEEAEAFEVGLIAKFGRRDLGTGILTNLTDGGDGGNNWDSMSKERQDAVRLKVSQNNRASDPKVKAKVAASKRGIKQKPETITKRIASMKGKTGNLGAKNGMYGKTHTKHARDAISNLNTGRKATHTQIAKSVRGSKLTHARKNKDLYLAIMQMIDGGFKNKEIMACLNICQDLITKLRKPAKRSEFEQLIEELQNAKQS